MNKIKLFVLRQANKISNFFKSITRVTGVLFGIKKTSPYSWDFNQFMVATTIFLIGAPILILILGSYFSVTGWVATILIFMILMNLDDALYTIVTIMDYGVDVNQPEIRAVRVS